MSNAFKSEAIKHFKINKNIMELQPKFTSDDPNFQPVYNQVQPLSMFKCTIVYCSLSILTISTIFWLIMFVWNMFHHYRLLYGNWYYTFYVFYCLLIIFKIISSLIESQLMINCHHLCRLLIMVRIVSFVEYLIFTRLIFSIVEVENVSEYKIPVKCILSLIRFISASLAGHLLHQCTSTIAWDIGDPL
ncbi:hypothetical protein BLOT_014823 [Blomia tropicalis]|nr:hypothetical protein BLOT_014823 [Blomia tropicalis]